jgi:hypothetical protein
MKLNQETGHAQRYLNSLDAVILFRVTCKVDQEGIMSIHLSLIIDSKKKRNQKKIVYHCAYEAFFA